MAGSWCSHALVISTLLLCIHTPFVAANLAEDIARSTGVEVADEVTSVFPEIDIPVLDTPEFDPTPAPVPPPDGDGAQTFQDTALGAAVSALPAGADEFERKIKTVITYWHQVALTAHQRDYSKEDRAPSGAPDRLIEPDQPGPCYTARALAMVHLAMYDAYVGLTEDAPTYLNHGSIPNFFGGDDIKEAAAYAAAMAAFRTLSQLYPADRLEFAKLRRAFDTTYQDLFGKRGPNSAAIWGFTVASAIRKDRQNDGSNAGPPFVDFKPTPDSTAAFQHVPDPTAVDDDGDPQTLYAPHWGGVKPFGHKKGNLPDFLQEPLANDYLGDFKQVLELGKVDSPIRTDEQTEIGIFWAYDGSLRIGTPPRLYAQNIDVVVTDSLVQDSEPLDTGFELVRLYAMTHTAMADATIAAWRDKYKFNFWRPIIGIRNADKDTQFGTAPFQDVNWRQLGAPKTNRRRPGINPAFPAYPSGHATIGTSAFEVAKAVLKVSGSQPFEMVSDEFNGVNEDENGTPRPRRTRTISLNDAIQENQDSRIFLGVHWNFDQTTGGALGERIAANIVSSFPSKA